ncbi:MAG: response regulator transcription factor [Bifidobacterium sp.]|uniref:Response regulator transcription factor n=1 Tax=Bifidobacterium fermentum TaxID=3059035 RepID=A0AB39UPF0_9BIFI
MISIVIADDYPLVREGISAMLRRHADLNIVAEASNGHEAIREVIAHRPDLLLLDLRMPDMEGPEVTHAVLTRFPDMKVLILTTYETDGDILPAIEAGANGYLLKDVEPSLLADAIRNTVAGETILAPRAARAVANQLHPSQRTELSEQERKVLALAADGRTNRQIASSLFISETTVKTYFSRIFVKLQVSDRTAAVAKMLRKP